MTSIRKKRSKVTLTPGAFMAEIVYFKLKYQDGEGIKYRSLKEVIDQSALRPIVPPITPIYIPKYGSPPDERLALADKVYATNDDA